ncbi:helix-turn-helix domain-containing protein [Streptomyces sp. INA 01156]
MTPEASDAHPRPLPDLHALQLLVCVAETGSLGRAAARLRISQPSASARMRTLERRLGLRLLDRSTSGSRLTRPVPWSATGRAPCSSRPRRWSRAPPRCAPGRTTGSW